MGFSEQYPKHYPVYGERNYFQWEPVRSRNGKWKHHPNSGSSMRESWRWTHCLTLRGGCGVNHRKHAAGATETGYSWREGEKTPAKIGRCFLTVPVIFDRGWILEKKGGCKLVRWCVFERRDVEKNMCFGNGSLVLLILFLFFCFCRKNSTGYRKIDSNAISNFLKRTMKNLPKFDGSEKYFKILVDMR